MAIHHLTRVGAMGELGRFAAPDARRYPRGTRVVVRTRRGLEIGRILADEPAGTEPPTDGAIVRGMTTQDELLAERLERHRHRAFDACTRRLAQRHIDATLIDVEHLFDGRSLFFYFLGEISPDVEALTAELAKLYEAKVKFRKFADAVIDGCGPDCGTDQAEGGCTHCTTCAVAGACGSAR